MAADLARARARINRAKRPYQPTLAAYFRLPTIHQSPTSTNTGEEDSASPCRTRPGEWRLANLDGSVQASLLNVGMRVRKAVSGGYQKQKQHHAQLGSTGDKENDSYGGVSGSRSLAISDINEHKPGDAVWKKRALEDIEEEDVFPPFKTQLYGTPISNQAHSASQSMETNQSARRIAQPTSRLWQRQKQPSQTPIPPPEPASSTSIAMDIDFGEADFLRPKAEIESDGGDAVVDIG